MTTQSERLDDIQRLQTSHGDAIAGIIDELRDLAARVYALEQNLQAQCPPADTWLSFADLDAAAGESENYGHAFAHKNLGIPPADDAWPVIPVDNG